MVEEINGHYVPRIKMETSGKIREKPEAELYRRHPDDFGKPYTPEVSTPIKGTSFREIFDKKMREQTEEQNNGQNDKKLEERVDEESNQVSIQNVPKNGTQIPYLSNSFTYNPFRKE